MTPSDLVKTVSSDLRVTRLLRSHRHRTLSLLLMKSMLSPSLLYVSAQAEFVCAGTVSFLIVSSLHLGLMDQQALRDLFVSSVPDARACSDGEMNRQHRHKTTHATYIGIHVMHVVCVAARTMCASLCAGREMCAT